MKNPFNYIIGSLSLVVLFSLLIPTHIMGQGDSSAVHFHGSNVLGGQYSSRQGYHSDVPKDFLRNDLQMSLSVFDIPIATNFFITTEQRKNMQRIDNLRIYIDLPTLKRNKARIEAGNKENNLTKVKAPWTLRFLSNFSKIEVGRVRPDYGELTLQGVPLSGVNLEFTNKIVYAAFASGTLKRPAAGDSIFEESYKQKLLFGKLGFGEKRTSHFYLTYMQIEDEATQPYHDPEGDTSTLVAQANVVIGAEFRLSFLKNKWTIDGDAGVTAITRDTRIPVTFDSVYIDSLSKKVPKFLVDAVHPNISSSADYGYGFSSKLNLKTTTISGGYRWIGPGYFTLGNPLLINDRQTFEGRVDQALLKRMVSVSAYYKRFNNNLVSHLNKETSISTSYGIIAKVNLKKGPYFQLSFTPNHQETSGNSSAIWNQMNIISFSTGYKYKIRDLKSFSSLNYFYQNSDYERDTVTQTSNTQTFELNQIFDFTRPFEVNFDASYTMMNSARMNNTISDRNVISIVISGTHTYKLKNHDDAHKEWRNTIGGKFLKSNNATESSDPDESKFSLFWDTQVSLLKYLDLGLSIDENIFRNASDADNYNEFIAQCKLIFKW